MTTIAGPIGPQRREIIVEPLPEPAYEPGPVLVPEREPVLVP
jgi:hypothetical protein